MGMKTSHRHLLGAPLYFRFENVRSRQLQKHKPSLRNAIGSPLGDGSNSDIAKLGNLRGAPDCVNDFVRFVRVHELILVR